jgi:hypothetical protein
MSNRNDSKVHASRSTLEIQRSGKACNFDVGTCKSFQSIDVTDRDGIGKTSVSIYNVQMRGPLHEVFKRGNSIIFGVGY